MIYKSAHQLKRILYELSSASRASEDLQPFQTQSATHNIKELLTTRRAYSEEISIIGLVKTNQWFNYTGKHLDSISPLHSLMLLDWQAADKRRSHSWSFRRSIEPRAMLSHLTQRRLINDGTIDGPIIQGHVLLWKDENMCVCVFILHVLAQNTNIQTGT